MKKNNWQPYLFGWAERCSGSCARCQPWPAFWHQCWSASSSRLCLPCPPPCRTDCRPSSPGCTCRRWCLCSWSCSRHWMCPFACFSFWMQSHCQPPPLTGGQRHVKMSRGERETIWEGMQLENGKAKRKETRGERLRDGGHKRQRGNGVVWGKKERRTEFEHSSQWLHADDLKLLYF